MNKKIILIIAMALIMSVGVLGYWSTYQNNLQSTGIQSIPYEIQTVDYISNVTSCVDGNGYQIQTGNFDSDGLTLEFVVLCGTELKIVDSDLNELDTYDFESGLGNKYELEDLDGDGINEIIIVWDTGTIGNFTILKYDRPTQEISLHRQFEILEDQSSVRCMTFAGSPKCFVNDVNSIRAFSYNSNNVDDDWFNNITFSGIFKNEPVIFADFDNDGDNDICSYFTGRIVCLDENRDISFNMSHDDLDYITDLSFAYDNEWKFIVGWGGSISGDAIAGITVYDSDEDEKLSFSYNYGDGDSSEGGSAQGWMDDVDDDGDNEFCGYIYTWQVNIGSDGSLTKIICETDNFFETEVVNDLVDSAPSVSNFLGSNIVLSELTNIDYENYTDYKIIHSKGIYGINESMEVVQLREWNFSGYTTSDDLNGDGISELIIVESTDIRLFNLTSGNINYLPVIEDYNTTQDDIVCGQTSTINLDFENFSVYDGNNDTQFKLITACEYNINPDDLLIWSFATAENLYTTCSYNENVTETYQIRNWITDISHENYTDLNELNVYSDVISVQNECTTAPIIVDSYKSPRTLCGAGIVSYTLDVVDSDGDNSFRTYTDCDNDGFWDKYSDWQVSSTLGDSCYFDEDGSQSFRAWITDYDHFTINTTYNALDELDSELFTIDVDISCTTESILPVLQNIIPDIEEGNPICLGDTVYFDNFTIYDADGDTSFSLITDCGDGQRYTTGLISESLMWEYCTFNETGNYDITFYVMDSAHYNLYVEGTLDIDDLSKLIFNYDVITGASCSSNQLPEILNFSFDPSENICINESLKIYNIDINDSDSTIWKIYSQCDTGDSIVQYSYAPENVLNFYCSYETNGTKNITAWVIDAQHEDYNFETFNSFSQEYIITNNVSCQSQIINTDDEVCTGHCLFNDTFSYDDSFSNHEWYIMNTQYDYDTTSFPFNNQMYMSGNGRQYLRVYIDNSDKLAYPISTLNFDLGLYSNLDDDDEIVLQVLDYYNDIDEPIMTIGFENGNIQYQLQGKSFIWSSSPYICQDCYSLDEVNSYSMQLYWNSQSVNNFENITEGYTIVFYINDELIKIIPFALEVEGGGSHSKEGYTGSLNFEKGYSTVFSLDNIYYFRGTNPSTDNTRIILFSNQSIEYDKSFGGWDSNGTFNCEMNPDCCAYIDGELQVIDQFCTVMTISKGWGDKAITWVRDNPLLTIMLLALIVIGIPIWLKLRDQDINNNNHR